MSSNASATTVPGASRLLDLEGVRSKLGGHPPPDPSTIYRMIQQGILPKPVKISLRMSRWIETEVDEAIQRRAEARTGQLNKRSSLK